MICLNCNSRIRTASPRIAGVCIACEDKVEVLVLRKSVMNHLCAIAELVGNIEPAEVVERLSNGHIKDIAEKLNGQPKAA